MDPHSSGNKSNKQVTQVVSITDLQSTIMQIVQEVMSREREGWSAGRSFKKAECSYSV